MPSPAPEPRVLLRRAQLWLGTRVEITAAAESKAALDAGIAAAFAAVARIHHALSGHDAQSELTRVNRLAACAEQSISNDLRAVLTCALDLAARSDGSFDPAVGARVASLGFLPRQACPDGAASWRDIALTADGVRFTRPLVMDFDGIAKGYAVDCAVAALRDHGVASGCVNAGGDLRVFGNVSEPIHVRAGGRKGFVLPLATLLDGAVATSAYGAQRRRVGGRWATPLIDPRNWLPVMSTRTVSVIAATCMRADALTKVVALRGRGASRVLRDYDASATVLSPAGGHWRCTQLPSPSRLSH
jgi:FAD:protein FMN transferase